MTYQTKFYDIFRKLFLFESINKNLFHRLYTVERNVTKK